VHVVLYFCHNLYFLHINPPKPGGMVPYELDSLLLLHWMHWAGCFLHIACRLFVRCRAGSVSLFTT